MSLLLFNDTATTEIYTLSLHDALPIWLDPHKIRKLTIGGSRKMVVFDDVESTEKVRIYDKSAEREGYESYGDAITLRFGDVVIPHVHMAEPLKLECQHFADCVRENKTPRSDGRDGLRVVRVLAAAQRSPALYGAPRAVRVGHFGSASRRERS